LGKLCGLEACDGDKFNTTVRIQTQKLVPDCSIWHVYERRGDVHSIW
jgi:hypothetical protein